MLLFAEPPDRLHAEILGPMGAPRVVVDAGGGVAAVALIGERTAYRGTLAPGRPLDFLGLEVSLEDLVTALVEGRHSEAGPQFVRIPEVGNGLPERFEIATADGAMRMRRLRFAGGAPKESIATGAVPNGFRILPLEDLGDGEAVFSRAAGEDAS
jgi:hypothetical protein